MATVGKRALASITKVSSLVQVNSGWILYTFIPYDYPYQYKHFVLTCLKGSRMGRTDKVSLWCVTLLSTLNFGFFTLE